MFVPKLIKKGHSAAFVSRKSVNRFIEHGLRIASAKPFLHFHQTLTFPKPITDAKLAKGIFTRFTKSLLKFYQGHELAVLYVQERRDDGVCHFHLCFLFFNGANLPFAPSRMYRDFRTDIFRRWNALNNFEAVHPANSLTAHPFNLNSMEYFTKALVVVDNSTDRPETNWWGIFNKEIIFNRSIMPSKQDKKAAFNQFFRKGEFQASKSMPEDILASVLLHADQALAQFDSKLMTPDAADWEREFDGVFQDSEKSCIEIPQTDQERQSDASP